MSAHLHPRPTTASGPRRRWLIWGVVAVFLGLVVAACSTDDVFESGVLPVSDDPALRAFDPTTEHFGLVVLTLTEERSAPSVSPAPRARLSGNAWFVEHGLGTREAVLTTLAALPTLDLVGFATGDHHAGESDSVATVGERCMLTERRLGGRASSTSGPVYFMDAGELALESDRGALFFQSAYFPDLDPDIGGLVYDADGPDARGMLASPTVRITGSGATEVGAFVAELSPPAPLRITRVDEQQLGRNMSRATHSRPMDRDLVVSWLSTQSTDEEHGVVSVRYVRQGFDRVAAVTCRVPDTGRYGIPREALAALPEMGDDQTDRLEVSRVGVSEFEAEGLDQAMAIFIARDVVMLRQGTTEQ